VPAGSLPATAAPELLGAVDPSGTAEQRRPAAQTRTAEQPESARRRASSSIPTVRDVPGREDVPGQEAVPGQEPVSYGPSVTLPGPVPAPPAEATSGFTVRLDQFTGPFDLLLTLIGKHQLEITELSLSRVTDEFIAYLRAMGEDWDLDETTEFLVVAATLLDLKAARLLPAGDVEDEEDLALLEARDLLFARLLQYRAFKEAAAHIAGRDAALARSYPRSVTLEPQYAQALPELVIGVGPDRLAQLAARALTPKPIPQVSMVHLHQVRVSIRDHAVILRERLLQLRTATFRVLCADCTNTLEIVARFLALLELYREGLVSFDQVTALGELTIRWTGGAAAGLEIEFDEYDAPPPADDPAPEPGGAASPPAQPQPADDGGTNA
jgi:segregation and condensation protein A